MDAPVASCTETFPLLTFALSRTNWNGTELPGPSSLETGPLGVEAVTGAVSVGLMGSVACFVSTICGLSRVTPVNLSLRLRRSMRE